MRSDLFPTGYQHVTAHDGVRLAYRVGAPRDGNAVLLLHGMASRGSTWDRVAQALIGRGCRVIVPDLRGHGRSGRAARYPLETFAGDAIRLLDWLGLENVDLIGHSLGGHTALTIAQRHPGRVRRLLIEDTPVPPRDLSEAHEVERQLTSGRILKASGVVRTVAIALWRRFDPKLARPTIAALRSPMAEWWAGMEHVRAPVLLLGGSRSHVPAARLALLAERLPHAELKVLEGGHRLHSEQHDAFLAAALPFLVSSERPSGTGIVQAV
jgi:esterase